VTPTKARSGLKEIAPTNRGDFFLEDLSTQSETLDERTVAVDVNVLQVAKKATTLTDKKQQSTTAVVVVLVLLEVFGEVLDALSQNCDLNLRRTGVTWVGCVFVDDCGLNACF
jgi:hypothetical protein